ncbi:MAG: hypothetical protein Q8M94_10925 [Ignavibacteria bacterium]|nr:hypothetical protein [Ignavibacteria bacterium]
MNNEQGMSNLEGQKLHHSLFLVHYSIFNTNVLPIRRGELHEFKY